MTYSTGEPPALPPGAAHKELISGLVHVDTGNGPDKWYTAGKDGTVRIWNGKVNKARKINVFAEYWQAAPGRLPALRPSTTPS